MDHPISAETETETENHPNLTKPTNFQGNAVAGGRKFGQEIRHNRRTLSVINQNLVGAKAYPCVVNKRGLQSERHENQLDPLHRPITRKFAAQISGSQLQHHPEESKKLQPKSGHST